MDLQPSIGKVESTRIQCQDTGSSSFVPEYKNAQMLHSLIWPIYDRQLHAFLLEIGSEHQRERPSFRKIESIHGPQGSVWIKKSQAAGLDTKTGYQGGKGDSQQNLQTFQTAQAHKPQQFDNTCPAPVQFPRNILGPTTKTTNQGISKLNQSYGQIQEAEQILKGSKQQPYLYTQSEHTKLLNSSSHLLHKVLQTKSSQNPAPSQETVARSFSLSGYQTPHPSSLSPQIPSLKRKFTKMDQQANMEALNQKRNQQTPDEEDIDLLHIAKRPCGSTNSRPLTPLILQPESRPTINEGTAQSNPDPKSYIDFVGVPDHNKPNSAYQSSLPASLQGQSNATAIQSTDSSGQIHRSPLDYVSAPGAYRAISDYQSPYLPANNAQTTIHHQTATSTENVSANSTPTNKLSDVGGYPGGKAHWTEHPLYHGPNSSYSRNSGHPNLQPDVPWNAGLLEKGVTESREGYRQLPGHVSPGYKAMSSQTPSEQVTGSQEGIQTSPELGKSERAILDHIAPWNASHPHKNAADLEQVLRPPPGQTSQDGSVSYCNNSAAPSDASLQTTNASQTSSSLILERLQSLPRPQTYYEFTGGTLPNRHPRETGVCSNMDFKTKKFIDAHGAAFTGSRSGPYRYMKPENRNQELAIIQATYQTIADFELNIGSSPRQKQQTWESYEFQYRQLQLELMARWVGPPELTPKLRCVEGWNESHSDHTVPDRPEPDDPAFQFARCKPGQPNGQPCYEHNRTCWTQRGCFRNLEEVYWNDFGDIYFAGIEARSTHVSAGNFTEERWENRINRLERLTK
ncbi:MAG: hypothetical protein Q9195_001174 [Heterodermia aff. obscurata]